MINYDQFADIYDIDMGCNIGDADIPFYMEYAKRFFPVVELGCGTGRVMKPILDEGIPVAGIDSSERMLEKTLEKLGHCKGTYELVLADLADFRLKRRFMLAICAFSTYSKLLSRLKQRSFLDTVFSHLSPGGIFIIDMFVNRSDLKEGEFILDYKDRWCSNKRCWITRRKRLWNNVMPQVNKIELEYNIRYEDGKTEAIVLEDYTRYSNKTELESLLEDAGFVIVNIFSDYEKRPFKSECEKMIFESRRKK